MKLLKDPFWENSNLTESDYDIVVETGAYRGDGIEKIKNEYKEIHSIELAEKWFAFCKDRFKNDNNVFMYLGDSKILLPEVLNTINKPVIVFLDAHFSGGTTAKPEDGDDSVLLYELSFLKDRNQNDIIILDDIGFCGQVGGKKSDKSLEEQEAEVWPSFEYDWSNTTQEKIMSLMKPNYKHLVNEKSLYVNHGVREDIFVWYPTT